MQGPVAAAQYVRMSTDHQQYSPANQQAAIQEYAKNHGFEIVRTYSDEAKSGLSLHNRTGLKQLLRDIVSGQCDFRAVLVYDVSRWGRFQDLDEAAHYEYLCKAAGVPVHYCAEPFANDCSLPGLIMKALKRTMAGEYSRELSVKVDAGHRRIASLGYKQGGTGGYAFRRLLVDRDGNPKQLLSFGDRKCLTTDRVKLVPGPPEEVAIVREIYRLLIEERRTINWIARHLNERGIPFTDGKRWDYQAVQHVLTRPKYMGTHVYGRTSKKLSGPCVQLPKEKWLTVPGAFQPIISEATFERAQAILGERTHCKTDEQVLDGLRKLWATEGRLSMSAINRSRLTASCCSIRFRFGNIRNAYAAIGYGKPEHYAFIDQKQRTHAICEDLVQRIVEAHPGSKVLQPTKRVRACVKFKTGLIVSVVVVRTMKRCSIDRPRWVLDPNPEQRKYAALIARLDRENHNIIHMDVVPRISSPTRFIIHEGHWFLKQARHLARLQDLQHLASSLRGKKKGS